MLQVCIKLPNLLNSGIIQSQLIKLVKLEDQLGIIQFIVSDVMLKTLLLVTNIVIHQTIQASFHYMHHWLQLTFKLEKKPKKLFTLLLFSKSSFSCNYSTKLMPERLWSMNWTFSQDSSATGHSSSFGWLNGLLKSAWFKLVELLQSATLWTQNKT